MIRQYLKNIGDSFYIWLLGHELRSMSSVLDVGCGSASPLSGIPKPPYFVGLDIFRSSIIKSKKRNIHDNYILCDVLKMKTKVKNKSFDAVVALDLIEHLKMNDGYKLLSDMEAIAKKKVIVMTPNGFYMQKPYGNNPYQIHKSGWCTNDFKKNGYTVYGIRGLKMLRGEQATLKYKPWIFWGAVSAMSQFLIYKYPSYSYQLFAIKDLNVKS